jgi:hypothetical protein
MVPRVLAGHPAAVVMAVVQGPYAGLALGTSNDNRNLVV